MPKIKLGKPPAPPKQPPRPLRRWFAANPQAGRRDNENGSYEPDRCCNPAIVAIINNPLIPAKHYFGRFTHVAACCKSIFGVRAALRAGKKLKNAPTSAIACPKNVFQPCDGNLARQCSAIELPKWA
jgi:hypothetical protein